MNQNDLNPMHSAPRDGTKILIWGSPAKYPHRWLIGWFNEKARSTMWKAEINPASPIRIHDPMGWLPLPEDVK